MNKISIALLGLTFFLAINGESHAKRLVACLKNKDKCKDICRDEQFQRFFIEKDPVCNREPFREGTIGCACE